MASNYEFDYVLTEDEIINGLKVSGKYKSIGKRGIVENIILIVFTMVFLISYINNRQTFELVMFIISILAILFLNLVPRIDMKRQAKRGQRDLRLRIYPDMIYVYAGDEPVKFSLSEAIIKYGHKEKVTVVRVEKGGMIVIPDRALPKENEGRIRAIIKDNS